MHVQVAAALHSRQVELVADGPPYDARYDVYIKDSNIDCPALPEA